MMKKLSYKYYSKRITTRDNGNVQSHDKEESKFSEKWCSYTCTWLNNKKSPYNENNVATIKINKILANILLLGLVE